MSGLLKIASGIENDFYYNFFSCELKTISDKTGFFTRLVIQIIFGINNSRVDDAMKEIFKRESHLLSPFTKQGMRYKETDAMEKKRWDLIDRVQAGLEAYSQRNNKTAVFVKTLCYLAVISSK